MQRHRGEEHERGRLSRMYEKWGYAYIRAVKIWEKGDKPYTFYMDDRCYTDREKVEFFKDLQVANNTVWEYLTNKLSKKNRSKVRINKK